MNDKKIKFDEWTLIDWDGNLELGYKCWRKSFGRGYVSVGVGEFTIICYSHGKSSDFSCSSTRWRKDRILTEQEVMDIVDRNNGYHNHKDNDVK